MRHPPHHIFEFTPATLKDWCADRGMKPFRVKQILEWVYTHGVCDPAAMSNLSSKDREILAAEMTFLSGPTVAEQRATDGTRKLLVEWGERSHGGTEARSHGGGESLLPVLGAGDPSRQTECVMIPAEGKRGEEEWGDDRRDACPTERGKARRTACVSSQVGCAVGCRFCASGLGGLDGNLSAGRIVEQVWRLRALLCTPALTGTPALRAGSSSHAPDVNDTHTQNQREPARGAGSGKPARSAESGKPARGAGSGKPARSTGSEKPARGAGSGKPARSAGVPRITNVVFMGMGEPLANFGPVVHAVRTLAADWGMGISARKITVSTVGMHKAIDRLADELELPVTLALSLHAPNDTLRRELIPWAEFTTIDQLVAACTKWFEKTGREITLEYILLGGVNDRPIHAEQLAAITNKLRANVNLIRYNEVEGLPFARPESGDVHRFQAILRQRDVNVHIRSSRGRDIAAACGQLRHEAGAK